MRWCQGVLAAAFVCSFAAVVAAHHSTVAEYDPNKPVKITGVVARVEWKNPHIWFFVNVTEPDGKITTWGFSGAPPGLLLRRGVQRDALKIGDTVVVEGFRARDGSPNASGGSVTLSNGRRVFTAAAEDPAPRSDR